VLVAVEEGYLGLAVERYSEEARVFLGLAKSAEQIVAAIAGYLSRTNG
jgi:hypothetical protein